MSEATFEVIRNIGVISSTKNSSLELRLIKWNSSVKYDLRRWGENGTKPYKGVTFTEGEIKKLLPILKEGKAKNKSMTPRHKVSLGAGEAIIYEVFGEYKKTNSKSGKVTYTSWGSAPKYDIRSWALDFSNCGKGVTLTESECDSLIAILTKELGSSTNDDYDTSSLDADLLI